MLVRSTLGRIMRQPRFLQVIASCVTLLLVAMPMTGLAQTRVKPGFNLFSAQQDIEIGKQSALEAEKQLQLIRDGRALEYLNRLGQRLSEQAPGERYPYTFKLVNAAEINAFALPGGQIYVNRATIEAAQSEADVVGAQIMARAGYDPLNLARFFETLQREAGRNPSGLEKFLSDHPAPADRTQRIEKEAALIKYQGGGRDLGGFSEVRSLLASMPKAPSAANTAQKQPPTGNDKTPPGAGGAAASIKVPPPSSNLRTYRQTSGVYEIAYPDNWRTYPGNDTLGMTFVPEGGAVDAQGQTQIIYGAMVNHYRPLGNQSATRPRNLRGGASGSQRVSLSEATNDLVNSIMQSNPYLRAVNGSNREAKLAGRNGLTATLQGRSPIYGRDERVTLYARAMDDGDIFYLLFITPNDDYRDYRGAFERMIKSLTINDAALHR